MTEQSTEELKRLYAKKRSILEAAISIADDKITVQENQHSEEKQSRPKMVVYELPEGVRFDPETMVDGNRDLLDEYDVLPTDWDPCVEGPITDWKYPDYKPDCKITDQVLPLIITVETSKGNARITSDLPWTYLGPYTVTGPGKAIARKWIKNAYGAFGHQIGKHASPLDLHAAAMKLKQEPEEGVTFIAIENDPGLPYDDGLTDDDRAAGTVT